MGIFSGLFGGSQEESKHEVASVPWIALNTMTQLDTIKEASSKRPQVIFKHSTTCGISRMALNMFKGNYSLDDDQMDFYFLDLHANRDISNAVSSEFGIQHQSPQLLILKNGVVVYHDSHGAIADVNLEKYL